MKPYLLRNWNNKILDYKLSRAYFIENNFYSKIGQYTVNYIKKFLDKKYAKNEIKKVV